MLTSGNGNSGEARGIVNFLEVGMGSILVIGNVVRIVPRGRKLESVNLSLVKGLG